MSVQQNMETVAPRTLDEKEAPVVAPATGAAESDVEKSEGSVHKQEGVQHVEAITSVLTKKSLWITFIL